MSKSSLSAPYRWLWCALAALLASTLVPARLHATQPSPTEWTSYGGTSAGTRYSPAAQIRKENVKDLSVAWIFRTGEDPYHEPDPRNLPSFEATSLKIGNSLYFCTPQNQ